MLDKNKILEDAKATLLIEAKALEGLLEQLNEDFSSAVELIHLNKGRLVVTGIGIDVPVLYVDSNLALLSAPAGCPGTAYL